MRRRSVLTAGAAGAAAVLAGGGKAMAATTATSAATATSRAGASGAATSALSDEPWASASLRDLAAKVGLRIGTAVAPADITDAAHSAIASGQFSVVTPENEMKWQVVEPNQPGTYDWSGADNLVAFAAKNKQLVRGHTLCWHNQLPNWLTTAVANGSYTKTQLLDLLQEHIFTEVGRYRGKIWQWDVANEFFTDSNPSGVDPNNWWIVNAGSEVIPLAFKWAHQADPGALLFYNDYNIAGEDGSNAKSDAVYAYVKGLLNQGVPIHGVGNQGHLDTQYGWNPTLLREDLKRYASLGLKVALTEVDVRTFVKDATSQVPTDNLASFATAYEYSEMLKAVLAVPEAISFTVWGFSDDESWIPGFFTGEGYSSLYDVNLQPKASYYSLQSDLALGAFGGAPQRVQTRQPTP